MQMYHLLLTSRIEDVRRQPVSSLYGIRNRDKANESTVNPYLKEGIPGKLRSRNRMNNK